MVDQNDRGVIEAFRAVETRFFISGMFVNVDPVIAIRHRSDRIG